jgi:hypothetical protein
MKGKRRGKKSSLDYREREYRNLERSGLVSSRVRMAETDLHILAPLRVEDIALPLVSKLRLHIEEYIRAYPFFAESLVPLPMDSSAPPVVREMLEAGRGAGVGPMAAVAGVIAAGVGQGLRRTGIGEVIVENGGDIFLARERECTIAVFAGESPLSNRVGIRVAADRMPCGVCCSSGTIGHSLSFGRADAVVVVASSTALADAAATRICNEVLGGPESITAALEKSRSIEGIDGVLIVHGDRLGARGAMDLIRL